MSLYEQLSGGKTPDEHRAESKAKAKAHRDAMDKKAWKQRISAEYFSDYDTKNPDVLKQRRKSTLPYLEFGTGVQGWGERGKDPNLNDLLWTLPVVAGTGIGAFKAGKDVYSRATTIPVWRGVRDKLKHSTKGDNIVGSPLYDEALHTTMNPHIGKEYAISEAFAFGGAEGGRLLKFRVPKKHFFEKGLVGPFQQQAEEIIFKKGLPKEFLEYSKKVKNLNPLQKLDNYLHSFGRVPKYPKDALGKDIIHPISKKLTKKHQKITDKRFAKAAALEEKGMKRMYVDEADWYNRNSQLRFTNPQGMKEVFKILKKAENRPFTLPELKKLKSHGWQFGADDPSGFGRGLNKADKQLINKMLEENRKNRGSRAVDTFIKGPQYRPPPKQAIAGGFRKGKAVTLSESEKRLNKMLDKIEKDVNFSTSPSEEVLKAFKELPTLEAKNRMKRKIEGLWEFKARPKL